MPLPAIIFRFIDSATLQFFCAAGFAIFVVCFFGLLLLRHRGVLHNAPAPDPPDQPAPEVIRISLEPAPIKTSEMTQQQKIAAALTRAGISNSAAWSATEASATQANSPANQVLPESENPHQAPDRPNNSAH